VPLVLKDGVSNPTGSQVEITVSDIPVGTVTIEIWGGKATATPILLQTLTVPFPPFITVVTDPGNIYSFVGIARNAGGDNDLSNFYSVYSLLAGLDTTLVEEIAEFLETAGIGTRGTDIFIITFPSTKKEGLLILPTGGTPPDVNKDCGQETITFSIQHRALENRPEIGFKKLIQVKRALHSMGDQLTTIKGIIEAQSANPVFLGVDGTNRTNVFTMPFQFRGPKR